MKRSFLNLISVILAALMIAGALSSCSFPQNEPDDTTAESKQNVTTAPDNEDGNDDTSASSTSKTETEVSVTDGEDTTPENTEGEGTTPNVTESESTKPEGETTKPVETESQGTSPEDSYVEETYPSLIDGENAVLIENADRLVNGVNAYYTDTNRNAFYFYNKNVAVTCGLRNNAMVSSISNKSGVNYIENTMDVFIKMNNGDTYYASNSSNDPIANIFKLGYYYYENRIEGQSFVDPYTFADPDGKKLNHTAVNRYNMCTGTIDENKVLKLTVTNNQDPWISFNNISYKASDYNILSLTMKVDKQFSTNISVYMNAGSRSGESSTSFHQSQSMGFDIIADGEYHTYLIPVYYISDYTGKVTGLRLDFMPAQGALDAQIEISDMRLLKATSSSGPAEVYLNRMFNTYSDKLHQTLQITALRDTENVQSIGIVTEIPADRVAKLLVRSPLGFHDSIEGNIPWNKVNYVGFDIKGAGIFGFILPYDGSGGTIKVTLEDGVYKIVQTKTPNQWTLTPSPAGSNNGNDFYMGHRIYTDTFHSFEGFIKEAELEINPLGAENFVINSDASTYGAFIGYDALRGCYTLAIDGSGGFGPPYKLHQNRQYNVTFTLKGDGVNDRRIYVLARYDGGGALECAALLDGKQMLLPVPLEVGKNFGEGGDSPIFCKDDSIFSETILPMVALADTNNTYSIVNLYYNWGKYPLKQISYIQYYSPYYHLSTGVHESNCIIPYYFTQWADTLNMLPDHRPMSGPFWEGDPQHTYCGVHSFLQYTDAEGNYYASENIKDTIGSYGPIYADITMEFISDDNKIKVTYNHMEFPQTDENRAFYEMKYEILEDVSFTDFAKDFSFYSVTSLDPTGLYSKVGYLDTNNKCQVAEASEKGESQKFVLGDECPYFSFFDMKNCGDKDRGYNNLSFLIKDAVFDLQAVEGTPKFVVINDYAKLSLSLDLGEVTLKAGDSFSIYAIIMPWQYYDVYDEAEPDQNVRRVRENTLLKPVTLTAGENCEKIESVFLPKAKTTNGKTATFTITGGYNNIPVRVYGFDKLTAPVIEELVDGSWQTADLSSFSTPDNFGYGYHYDGYGVYYDGDGTYSYSFVFTMALGESRTFRITAIEDFMGWPEVIKEPDPMNFWLDAQDLNAPFAVAGKRFGEISMMSEDGINFLRIKRNGTASEATVSLFENAEGTLAGRYLVFKYRVPQGAAANIKTWQFYTSTENVMYDSEGNILIVGQDFNASAPTLSDGNWHVIVMDLSSYANRSECFKQDEDGNYYIQYLRFDTFNPEYATDAIVDIAYIGMHDSLDEILEYNKADMPTVALFTNNNLEYVSTKNNEALNLHIDAAELDAIIDRFKGRFHSVTLSENRDYITFAGSVGNEAIADIFKGNKTETGRYLILKYRIPEADTAPFGYWQFYINTDGGAASGENDYSCEGYGTQVIADGKWQVLIVDLEARGEATYSKNADGKYVADFFRFDFFNSQFGAEVSYDIAYIAFSDSLGDIYAYESDMDYVTISTAAKVSAKYDPTTGEEIKNETDDDIPGSDVVVPDDDIPGSDGEETTESCFNYILDAEKLNAGITPSKAKFHSVTLSESGEYITLSGCTGNEAAIEFFKNSARQTGRYLVLKYRLPEADTAPFGYWQFYINTDGSGADNTANGYYCEGYGTQVISDGEWQVLIVDLEARGKESYAKNDEGKYIAKFFRFDFFNSKFGEEVTYDLEYIAFSDSLENIYEYESDMDYVTLCTAQKESVKIDPTTGAELNK